MSVQVGGGGGYTERDLKRIERIEQREKLFGRQERIRNGEIGQFVWQAIEINPYISQETQGEVHRIELIGLRHDHLYDAKLLIEAYENGHRPELHLILYFDLSEGIQDAPLNDPYKGTLVNIALSKDEDDVIITLLRSYNYGHRVCPRSRH